MGRGLSWNNFELVDMMISSNSHYGFCYFIYLIVHDFSFVLKPSWIYMGKNISVMDGFTLLLNIKDHYTICHKNILFILLFEWERQDIIGSLRLLP